jgi:hypothetical protein
VTHPYGFAPVTFATKVTGLLGVIAKYHIDTAVEYTLAFAMTVLLLTVFIRGAISRVPRILNWVGLTVEKPPLKASNSESADKTLPNSDSKSASLSAEPSTITETKIPRRRSDPPPRLRRTATASRQGDRALSIGPDLKILYFPVRRSFRFTCNLQPTGVGSKTAQPY